MELYQKKMIDVLKQLRDEYGVTAVKAEFEAEGTRTDEFIMLNEVIHRADVGLVLKIGGCEAVRDLEQARILGATTIVAPMIESPFAMSKYAGAAKKVFGDRMETVEWAINTETKQCHAQLDEILEAGKGFLDSATIGRVDLSASIGLDRSTINSDTVLDACKDIAQKCLDAGVGVSVGGGINFAAIPFLREMKGYVSHFETRKVSFEYTDDADALKQGILLAMEFETQYLEGKCQYYGRLANEDKARLAMMHERLEKAYAEVGR